MKFVVLDEENLVIVRGDSIAALEEKFKKIAAESSVVKTYQILEVKKVIKSVRTVSVEDV